MVTIRFITPEAHVRKQKERTARKPSQDLNTWRMMNCDESIKSVFYEATRPTAYTTATIRNFSRSF